MPTDARSRRLARRRGRTPPPRWVAIRQAKFAIRVREIIYGHRARPLGRIRRQNWIRLCRFYVRSRALRYGQVLAEALALGAELREAGEGLEPDDATDQRLRDLLSARLADAAKRKTAALGPDHHRLTQPEAMAVWAVQWVKECALNGICAACGDDLPCDGCGVPALGIDGAGGLRPV